MEAFEDFGFEEENKERAKGRLISFVRNNGREWRHVAELSALEDTAFTYHLMYRMGIEAEGIDQESVPAKTRGEALITGYLLAFSYQKELEELVDIPVASLPSYENIVDTLTLSDSSELISLANLVEVGRDALEADLGMQRLFHELRDDLLASSSLSPFYQAGGGFCTERFSGVSMDAYTKEGITDLENLLIAGSEAENLADDVEGYLREQDN